MSIWFNGTTESQWAIIVQALAALARTGNVDMSRRAIGAVDIIKEWQTWLWLKTSDKWHRTSCGRWM